MSIQSCPIEVVIHKNLELSVRVRRLRSKLMVQKRLLESQSSSKHDAEALINCFHRSWDFLLKECMQLLNKIPLSISESKTSPILDSFLDPKAYDLLLTQVVREIPGAEEEEEGVEVENKLAKVENVLDKKVRMMLKVLEAVVENIVTKGNEFRDEATSRLVGDSTDILGLKQQVKLLEQKCTLYSGRIKVLEDETVKLSNQFEDADNQKDVALRRLAKVLANALSTIEIGGMVQKMQDSGMMPADIPGIVKPAVQSDPSAESSNEEAVQLRELAESRLKELEVSLAEKKTLIETVEMLRNDVASANAKVSEMESNLNRSNALDESAQQIQDLKLQLTKALKLESESRVMMEKLRSATNGAEAAIETQVAELVKSHESDLIAKDKEIATIAVSLEATRKKAKEVESQKADMEELNKSIEIQKSKIDLLSNQVRRLESSEAVQEYKNLLDRALLGSFPEKEQTRTNAVLEAEIAACKAQIEHLKSETGSDELVQEISDMQEVLKETEDQNERLQSRLKAMEKEFDNVNQKVLSMYDQVGKQKQKNKALDIHYHKEKDARLAHDKDYEQINFQVSSLLQANAHLETVARAQKEEHSNLLESNTKLERKLEEATSKISVAEAALLERAAESTRTGVELEEARHTLKRLDEEKKKVKRKLVYFILDPGIKSI